MTIQNTGEAEHAAALIDKLLEWQCVVSIHDGEEVALRHSTDRAEILRTLGATDTETVMAYNAGGSERLGNFLLVYGNSPDELVADHTDNPFCRRIWDALEPVREKLEA